MRPVFERGLPGAWFGVFPGPPGFLCHRVGQEHGNRVVDISESPCPADGMAAAGPSAPPMAVTTADCLPVALLGEGGRALLHAGWAGIEAGVHLAGRVRSLGPRFAFVGPHIQAGSFEVGEDFAAARFRDSPDLYRLEGRRITFDLFARLERDLARAFPGIEVVNCGRDTLTDPLFHSHRRDGARGRNHNVLADSGWQFGGERAYTV